MANFVNFKIYSKVFQTGSSLFMYVSRSPIGGFWAQDMKSRFPSRMYPPKVPNFITSDILFDNLINLTWEHQYKIFMKYGRLNLQPSDMHLDYLFIHPLSFSPNDLFMEELKLFYWYTCNYHTFAIQFPMANMPRIIGQAIQEIGDRGKYHHSARNALLV